MYSEIRNKILEYETLFSIVHFIYTPIRETKEYIVRRKLANKLIKKYRNICKKDKKIFYFGIPEHNNLGDMAQTFCTRKWLAENYSEYCVLEIRTRISFDNKFIAFMEDIINSDDILMFQSGYCTRTKNPDHLMHLNIISKFPNQKSIILPQTVKLHSEKDVKKTKNIFSKCHKLLFIARDNISYNNAKEFVEDQYLELFPDIVTSLIGRINFDKEKNGALLCVRNDGEKFYSNSDIERIRSVLIQYTERVDITDTNSHMDVWETYGNLEKIIYDKISNFSKYKVIITDRYHGTIFSLIANTPVIVIKTNDHKVTSGVDWFQGIYAEESVRLANDLEEACQLAIDIMDKDVTINNDDYFYRSFYKNCLKDRIESIR